MESSEFTSVILSFGAVSLGAFLGALGNKLVTHNSQTNWKWGFYLLSIISFLIGIIYPIIIHKLVFNDYFGIFILLISSISLFVFTKKFLDRKFIYASSELDPIINNFTSNADHNEIKLFGGDLNFFGNGSSEMDRNSQYNHLKSLSFKKVAILCEFPSDIPTKIRYGKILNEAHGVELRFYNPEEADLRIRGRLKTIQGVEKLLIYTKIDSGKYQTIETDTANSNGALYNNIWKLIWSLATKLDEGQRNEYINLYNGG